MNPVLTPAEMRELDASSGVPEDVLIHRAGTAVAWAARSLLGGTYGRRVTVLAGPGNNGADGRVAAALLASWGVRVTVVGVSREVPPPRRIDDADLVIDAILGTGSIRPITFPTVGARTKVLSVDVPSGVDARTGQVSAECTPPRADLTVTFVAPKPGLLFEPGASYVGELQVVDLGIGAGIGGADSSRHSVGLLDEETVRHRLRRPGVGAHKWNHAVLVVAGSPGMTGAALLTAHAAARSGASLVRLSIPGAIHTGDEIVGMLTPSTDWAGAAAGHAQRCSAVAVGPGLGAGEATRRHVRSLIDALPPGLPVVIDGDGIGAVTPEFLAGLTRPVILTPHDGEFARLAGHLPGADRIEATRMLARSANSTVLAKGPTTVVAAPHGEVELIRAADQRLATAGSGDVLTGVIAAFCAQGYSPFEAASTGAFVHGAAAMRGRRVGLLAGDLPGLIADVLNDWSS